MTVNFELREPIPAGFERALHPDRIVASEKTPDLCSSDVLALDYNSSAQAIKNCAMLATDLADRYASGVLTPPSWYEALEPANAALVLTERLIGTVNALSNQLSIALPLDRWHAKDEIYSIVFGENAAIGAWKGLETKSHDIDVLIDRFAASHGKFEEGAEVAAVRELILDQLRSGVSPMASFTVHEVNGPIVKLAHNVRPNAADA